MENTESDHSPPLSENAGSTSWTQWEHEISSISGLNLDSTNELRGLVEDKEVAARAVAFVVNSTRKGIVPLCADVANLLRSKRSLERKIYLLKRENDALRTSASMSLRTSNSTSPTPPSLSSYIDTCTKGLLQDQGYLQDRFRPCSRCSQCSSIQSYSPRIGKSNSFRLSGVQYSPASSHDSRKHSSTLSTHSSFRSQNGYMMQSQTHNNEEQISEPVENSKFQTELQVQADVHAIEEKINSNYTDGQIFENKLSTSQSDGPEKTLTFSCQNEIKVEAEVHQQRTGLSVVTEQTGAPSNTQTVKNVQTQTGSKLSEIDIEPVTQTCDLQALNSFAKRRNTLPEIVSCPSESIDRVCLQTSREVQCSLYHHSDRTLEQQFIKTVRLNSKLAEDLGAARKEIEVLKGKLKELEMSQLAKDCLDQVFYENECDKKAQEDKGFYSGASSSKSLRHGKHGHNNGYKRSSPKRSAATPVSYSGPLPACKCSACQEAMGSEDDLSHYSDQLTDESPRYAVNSKLQVQMDDHVVVKGERTGFIRYIGHIDRIGQSNVLFVGLELDAAVGGHDGFFNGKRYFYCHKDHGIFVPLQDVICKVSKKITKGGKTESSLSAKSRKGNKKIVTDMENQGPSG